MRADFQCHYFHFLCSQDPVLNPSQRQGILRSLPVARFRQYLIVYIYARDYRIPNNSEIIDRHECANSSNKFHLEFKIFIDYAEVSSSVLQTYKTLNSVEGSSIYPESYQID